MGSYVSTTPPYADEPIFICNVTDHDGDITSKSMRQSTYLYSKDMTTIAIQSMTDADGDAHSMQIHPDGYADYVSHRPEELEHGLRWISRTEDEDALGLASRVRPDRISSPITSMAAVGLVISFSCFDEWYKWGQCALPHPLFLPA